MFLTPFQQGNMVHGCSTDFRFIASMTLPPIIQNDKERKEGSKISIVLARPRSGKWHQIRQHLASGTVGHAILGDSSHGRSRTNRIWKNYRNMINERTCLHLARMQIPSTEYTPEGIDVSCPMPDDFMTILKNIPGLVEKVKPILLQEGINLQLK